MTARTRSTSQPWKWLLAVLVPFVACDGGSRATGPATYTLHAVSGGGQSGVAGRTLDEPLAIELRDGGGRPVPWTTVGWSAPGGSIDPAVVVTDALGRASVAWALGPAIGEQVATATVEGGPALVFRASARAAVPAVVELVGTDDLYGYAESEFSVPLAVRVLDDVGMPVEGVVVAWSVTADGGTVAPATTLTDATGIARGSWTPGSLVGWHGLEARAGTLPAFTVRARTGRTVGPAGGTLRGVDGVVTLDIPAGALSREIGLFVLPAPNATDTDLVAGTAYEFGPASLMFGSRATLSMAVTSAEHQQALASNGLAIHWLFDDEWVELAGSVPASAGGAVTVPLTGFGVYGVLVRRPVATIAVTPANASATSVGAVTSFGVVLRDASGNPLDAAARHIEWSSDQASVATVDAVGRVTAVGSGQATITARVGSVSGSATFNVP